jgi:hypothetical protein
MQPEIKSIREHLEEMRARRVWLGTCDATVEDLADAGVADNPGQKLLDQPAYRTGHDLIDPRDGGRWLTVTERFTLAVCVWNEEVDGEFNTACGKAFVFTHSPGDEFQFCIYCGRTLSFARRDDLSDLDQGAVANG